MRKTFIVSFLLCFVSILGGCAYNGSLSYYEELNRDNRPPPPSTITLQEPVNNKASADNKGPITNNIKPTAKEDLVKSVKREGYSIQVGAFKNADNAGRLADNLDKRGLDAFLFREKGIYKVRFGNFGSRDEARNRGAYLRSNGVIEGFFVVAPEDYSVAKAVSLKNGGGNYIRGELVNTAHQYIGVPYIWGGTTEAGFDCSGLTRAVYRLNGISIPRVSRDQFKYGKSVNKSNLQIGDLVFFATAGGRRVSHVGVYIGGSEFIHAPSKGKTVRKANLDSSYWSKRYVGARNYL